MELLWASAKCKMISVKGEMRFRFSVDGDAENARHEIAGHENAAHKYNYFETLFSHFGFPY